MSKEQDDKWKSDFIDKWRTRSLANADQLDRDFEKYSKLAAEKGEVLHDTPIWQMPEPWPEKEWREYQKQQEAKQGAKLRRDYSKQFDNVAIYAPALSETYVRFVEAGKFNKANVPFLATDLNFLDPDCGLFHYPWALYSAGQAADTAGQAAKTDWVSRSQRATGTHVVGDSGGFQIQQNTIKFRGASTLNRMLRWMEKTSDYSMILDVPTGGIGMGNARKYVGQLDARGFAVSEKAKINGFNPDYMACLMQTEINNRYFRRYRQHGKTKLLNVIQGRNEKESRYWYERMKAFPFEGIAFAGKHSVRFSMTMRRIRQMLDDGLLKNCPWIHFLGVSTFRTAAALTFLQRELRLHPNANQNIQITFDSISGIKAVANGYNAYTGFDFDPSTWRFTQEKISVAKYQNSKRVLNEICAEVTQNRGGSKENKIPGFSVIGWSLQLGQMIETKPDKEGNPRLYMPEENGFCLMNHNMEIMIRGFQQLGNYLDKEGIGMPQSITTIMYLIRTIIFPVNNYDPFELIDEAAAELDAIAMRID
ncbi:MAG: hypothetical protein ABJM29_10570 [Rhizobiaceae bacterium]